MAIRPQRVGSVGQVGELGARPGSGGALAFGANGAAKHNLRQLLAECVIFQDAIGAVGTEQERISLALSQTYITANLPDEEWKFVRPFALITNNGSSRSMQIATNTVIENGDLELWIEDEIAEGFEGDEYRTAAELAFENFYEQWLSQAMALSQMPGYFVINSFDNIEGPARFEAMGNDKDTYFVRLRINWGPE